MTTTTTPKEQAAAEAQFEQWLEQFDLEEQERILRYALDHVVPNLVSKRLHPLASTPAPAVSAEPVMKLRVIVHARLEETTYEPTFLQQLPPGEHLLYIHPATIPPGEPSKVEAVAFTQVHVDYVARYGGNCRDCADENGVCPSSGLPCGGAEKAIRRVFDALTYGINHRFIASPFAAHPKAEPAGVPDADPQNAAYPRDWFEAVIFTNSPYAFYLFQWVPYQTEAKRWRLKMLHDARTFDGREAFGVYPNGSSVGPFKDHEVEFIRISRKQWGGEWQDPRPAAPAAPQDKEADRG